MKKWLIPSIENAVGFFLGVACAGLLGGISHRALGNHRVLNDTVVYLASCYGFDSFTVAMIVGAIAALVISFVATHIVEKKFRRKL